MSSPYFNKAFSSQTVALQLLRMQSDRHLIPNGVLITRRNSVRKPHTIEKDWTLSLKESLFLLNGQSFPSGFLNHFHRMKVISSRLRKLGPGRVIRHDSAASSIIRPKSHPDFSKCIEIRQGSHPNRGWNDDYGLMGEEAVPCSLAHRFSPVVELALERDRLGFGANQEFVDFGESHLRLIPRNRYQIGDSIPVDRNFSGKSDFASASPSSAFLETFSVSASKGDREAIFRARRTLPSRQVVAWFAELEFGNSQPPHRRSFCQIRCHNPTIETLSEKANENLS